jgi:glycerol-3-phosphate O-acyltransferase
MAAGDGTTQAIFPEGGLSLNGRVGPAKLGLLGYLVQGLEPGGRDVVFVPVGLAYDRVLEDRVLVEAHRTGVRRFRARPLAILAFVARMGWRKLRGRFQGFGTAAVAFGTPMSLRALIAEHPGAEPEALTEVLGARLMASIADCVPVLPVPLVAAALAEGPVPRAGLVARVDEIIGRLASDGAALELRSGGAEVAVADGLRVLVARHMVAEEAGVLRAMPENAGLLAFYAGAVQQRLERTALPAGSAVACVPADAAAPQT